MALWTATDAALATGGQATGDWAALGVSIDTRTIRPGDLFVALSAARDGHDFVADALGRGAAAAMVSRVPEGVDRDAPLLLVDDVLEALVALGRAGRARMRGKVIGITGSVGKTSSKEMLRAALAGQGSIHAAEASYNNHWGVPLTLARMPADTDLAIIEMGMNHPGEIAPLSRMARPHVALITTIAAAHIGAFGSLEAIAREKGAIFEGLEPGGTAVIPTGLSTSWVLRAAADAAGAPIASFGPDGGARLIDATPEGEGLRVVMQLGQRRLALSLPTPARHFAANAVGVLTVVDVLGLDVVRAAEALAGWRPPIGRGAVEVLGGLRLVDDSYNANPESLRAGLATLAAMPASRRVAFLGDMLELGDDAASQHAALASDEALSAVDLVHAAGPLMRHLFDALPAQRRGLWTATADELAAEAPRLVGAGDAVLVKGSNGSRISRVVETLRRHAAGGNEE